MVIVKAVGALHGGDTLSKVVRLMVLVASPNIFYSDGDNILEHEGLWCSEVTVEIKISKGWLLEERQ